MKSKDILMKPLLQIIHMLKAGIISSEEVLSHSYARIEKIKPLNSFISVVKENHNKQCTQSSLLKGVPYAIKDNFCTKDVKTTCASYMLKNYIPTYNSTVVNKLSSAGGIMVGKTNLDEFAMGSGSVDSIFGPVRNPWQYDFNATTDTDWFIAGGSSGGSAVAVATGASYFAVGSDTGGSVRIPASLCGVVGFKPSYGSISRHGLISLVNSMDVPGILARTVDDAGFIYNILCGHDPLDSTTLQDKVNPIIMQEKTSMKDLVVGIPKEYYGPTLSSEIKESWCKAADIFSNAGANVIQVSLPHTQYAIPCYHVLSKCEIASNMARYDGLEYGHRSGGCFTEEMYARSRNEGFNEAVRGRIVAGNYFLLKANYKTYCEQAQRVRRLILNDFKEVFKKIPGDAGGVDVLLTPATPSTAPLYKFYSTESNQKRTAEQDIYTQAANLAGVPAISVPVSLSNMNLPISLQLIANTLNEEKLLNVAKFLEGECNFSHLNLDFQ